MIFVWMVNTFVYYGLSYNINDLAGNTYLNVFIARARRVSCLRCGSLGHQTVGTPAHPRQPHGDGRSLLRNHFNCPYR
ncbi:hypothetical protein TNCT_473591 [Trichonephila clavata]|uniref:Uncharacterized protein n=1 Tax=Trichonephila clavata TaxID=2740835 RepID=A0A8X6I3Y1_TRICU|nr:hypothetical protein TNCT_473591 [Trichonephila clavata]